MDNETFIENIREKIDKDANWTFYFVLINGHIIEIQGKHIKFHKDFLHFDITEANITLPATLHSEDWCRMIKVPYSSILYFTDKSSQVSD